VSDSTFADDWAPDPDGWRRHTYDDGTLVEYGPEAPCAEPGCPELICRDDDYACDGDCGGHYCDTHLHPIAPGGAMDLCRRCHPGPLPAGEPILVDCDGSGSTAVMGVCPVCGQAGIALPGGLVIGHQRDDTIARLERGDYDTR
jgi:hypothetical protein